MQRSARGLGLRYPTIRAHGHKSGIVYYLQSIALLFLGRLLH